MPSVFRSYRENSNTRLSGFVHSWIKLRTSLYSAGVNCCLFNSIVRTTSIVFPLGVIVRVTLPKGLLITCSCVEVCNFMPSAGVTVYVTSSLIREGSSNKLERLLFKHSCPSYRFRRRWLAIRRWRNRLLLDRRRWPRIYFP